MSGADGCCAEQAGQTGRSCGICACCGRVILLGHVESFAKGVFLSPVAGDLLGEFWRPLSRIRPRGVALGHSHSELGRGMAPCAFLCYPPSDLTLSWPNQSFGATTRDGRLSKLGNLPCLSGVLRQTLGTFAAAPAPNKTGRRAKTLPGLFSRGMCADAAPGKSPVKSGVRLWKCQHRQFNTTAKTSRRPVPKRRLKSAIRARWRSHTVDWRDGR